MPLELPEQHRSKASWWPRALIFSPSLRFAGSCVSEKADFSKAEAGKRNTLEVYVPSWVVIRWWFVIVLRETVKIACVCGWCNLQTRENEQWKDFLICESNSKVEFYKAFFIHYRIDDFFFFFLSVYQVLWFVLGGTAVNKNRHDSDPHEVSTPVEGILYD